MNNERENFFNYVETFYEFGFEILDSKNKDYSGEDTDPLRNFKDASLLAGVTVEQGLLVRMADKIARIRNLTKKKDSVGEVGEKLEDTLMDLSNYSAILSYYVKTNYIVPEEFIQLPREKEDKEILPNENIPVVFNDKDNQEFKKYKEEPDIKKWYASIFK